MTAREGAALPQMLLLYASGACFLLETSGNAMFGFRYAGGFSNFVPAFLMASGSVAVAVIGAVLAIRWGGLSWRRASKYGIGALMACCVLFSWVCGLRVVGVTLADGGLKRDRAATQGLLAGDKLETKRAARKALGSQPAPSQIEGLIAKEMAIYITKADKTVAVATKECADPSWAPQACKRVADLRVRLADAKQAVALDGEIEAAASGLGAAPVVAAGDPDLAVLAAMTQSSRDDVKFWLPVAIVTLMTMLANFGPMLAGVHGAHAAPPDDPSGRLEPLALPYHLPPSGMAERTGGGQPPQPPQPPFQPPFYQLPSTPAAAGGPTTMTGAPINIHFGSGAGAPPAAQAVYPVPAGNDGRSGVAAAVIARRPREDLAALPADVPPVDRSAVPAGLNDGERQAVDVLLHFKAACLVDMPGAHVQLAQLYQRYRAWVGERAVPRVAFDALIAATGIEVVVLGGDPLARGVGVKAAPALQAV